MQLFRVLIGPETGYLHLRLSEVTFSPCRSVAGQYVKLSHYRFLPSFSFPDLRYLIPLRFVIIQANDSFLKHAISICHTTNPRPEAQEFCSFLRNPQIVDRFFVEYALLGTNEFILKSDFLISVNINITILWDVTPCLLVVKNHQFGGTCWSFHQIIRNGYVYSFEDGGSRFLRNTDICKLNGIMSFQTAVYALEFVS
jgi:hypothetical protein